jgi:hypothetical protein
MRNAKEDREKSRGSGESCDDLGKELDSGSTVSPPYRALEVLLQALQGDWIPAS